MYRLQEPGELLVSHPWYGGEDFNHTDIYLNKADFYYLGVNKKGNKTYIEKLHKAKYPIEHWRFTQCYEQKKDWNTLDLFPGWEEITDSEFHPYEKFKEFIPYPTLNEKDFKEFYDYMKSLKSLIAVEKLLELGYSRWSDDAQKHCNLRDLKMYKRIENKKIPKIRKVIDKLFSKICK